MTTHVINYMQNAKLHFVECPAEEVAKHVRNIKRRKGVDKDSIKAEKLVAAMTDAEKLEHRKQREIECADKYGPVEETDSKVPEGYISFTAVAQMLGVRYQQVFQKHKQNKLGSLRVSGKWYANAENVDVWQERRIKYLSSQQTGA